MNISGYHNIVRNDRLTDKAGGVAIYCKNNIKHIDRKEFNISHNDIETVWVEITLPQTRPILICTVYRPENSLTSAIEILENQVSSVSQVHTNAEIIIMGDINVDYMNKNYEYRHIKCLEQLFQLTQLVSENTRITEKSSSCIDHIYTNREEMVVETGVVPLGLSDHSLTYIVRKGKKNKAQVYLYKGHNI